jgi:hypothetical protein
LLTILYYYVIDERKRKEILGMFITKKLARILFVMTGLVALSLIYSPISQAQNWAALPPYNTLWPLWSPALAPVDPITGMPVPIVSELIPSTVLPVQPGLTWDPSAVNPWLLYNTPVGMAYYDPIGGVNLWPPSYLRDTSGSPLPLTLPFNYAFLPPITSSWLGTNIPLGNAAFFSYLMTLSGPLFGPGFIPAVPPAFGPTFASLFLPPSALFPPAILPVAPLPIPTALLPLPVPTAFIPVPTAFIPVPTALLPIPTAFIPVPTALLPIPTAFVPLPVTTFLPPTAVTIIPPLTAALI